MLQHKFRSVYEENIYYLIYVKGYAITELPYRLRLIHMSCIISAYTVY
jgi:hypothetical protein